MIARAHGHVRYPARFQLVAALDHHQAYSDPGYWTVTAIAPTADRTWLGSRGKAGDSG